MLPGYETSRGPRNANIDPDKAAFSTAGLDEEAYAPVGMNDHDDEPEFNASPYGGLGLGPGAGSGGASATGSMSAAPHDPHDMNAYSVDTSYGGAASVHTQAFEPHPDDYLPSRTSPLPGRHLYSPSPAHDDEDEFDEHPAQFPAADYSRVL